jgi:hypothetical protein
MRKTFTRLGTLPQINAAASYAKKNGATVLRECEGLIIKAKFQDDTLFTAVRMNGKTWAITYSLEYYAEPEFPRPAPVMS